MNIELEESHIETPTPLPPIPKIPVERAAQRSCCDSYLNGGHRNTCKKFFKEAADPLPGDVPTSRPELPPATNHDPVNHPKHYTSHPSGIECIEITRHMSFNVGNAFKYLWRADLKNGMEDLKKAKWYIEDEIKKREKFV